jgi:hypothetical protein
MTRPLHRIHEDLIVDIRCIEHRWDNAIKTGGVSPVVVALTGGLDEAEIPFGWHNGVPVFRGSETGMQLTFDGGSRGGSYTIEWLGFSQLGTYDADFTFDVMQGGVLSFEGTDIGVFDDVVAVQYPQAGFPLHVVASLLMDGEDVDTATLMVNGEAFDVSSAVGDPLEDNTILYGFDYATCWFRIYGDAMETTEMRVLYEHAKRTIPSDTWRRAVPFIAPSPS